MRITTYEKGGNSLNPFIRLFVFLIILGLFVMPVSAFEDDFNDNDMTDWVIGSGTWSTKNTSSILGGADYYGFSDFTSTPSGTSTNTEYVTQTIGDFVYFEFDVKQTSSIYKQQSGIDGYLNAYTRVYFSDTDYFQMRHYGSGARTIDFTGFTYTPVAYTNNAWYHIEMTFYDNNNIKVDVYKDDALVNSQTSTYLNPNDNTIKLYSINADNYNYVGTYIVLESDFDNIVTSESFTPTITNIVWHSDQYIEGDTASYSWSIQTTFWQNLIYKYQVQILKDGIEIDTVRISQIGTGFQDVDTAGTYEVKLQYSGLIFTNWQTMDNDNAVVVPEVDSFINVPQTTAIKTNFTTTYLYGSTPISPIINIKVLQNDYTYKVIDTKILPSVTAGTTYTTNLSISSLSPIGYYVVELYDNGQGKSFATDTIQTTYAYIPPSDVVLSSYVNTTNNVYSLGGIISGSYAIDDTNYTNYYTKLQVYNIDKDIISFSFIPLHQVDNFDIPITNSELDFYSDGVNRYPISTNFLSGENAVRLVSYNTDGSLNEVITQKNITLSIINDEGYGLTLSKYIVDETEIFAIKAITPVQASIVIHPLTLMGISDTTILINGSTQMSYAIGIADTYTISLVSGGETKITQIIKVFEGEEIIAPIDEGEVIPDTTFQDNTTSLLNSPYLIGLFIMCVFLAIGATNGIGGTIVTGSIGLGIVCYMGIFPWILLVIEVLVVAVLLAKGAINLSGD